MTLSRNWTLDELGRIAPDIALTIAAKMGRKFDPKRGSFSAAKKTDVAWNDGTVVTCASKTEARVARRLLLEARAANARIYRNVHVALLSIAPRAGGIALTLTVDFVLRYPDGRKRYIDAKTKRKSREWARGKAAAEAELGIKIEETDR